MGDGKEREEERSPIPTLQVIHRRLDCSRFSSKFRRARVYTARPRGSNRRPCQLRQSQPARSRCLMASRSRTIPGCRTCAPSVARTAKRVTSSGRLPNAPSLPAMDTYSPVAGFIFGITSSPLGAPSPIAPKDSAHCRTSTGTLMELSATGPRGRLTAGSAARNTREWITYSDTSRILTRRARPQTPPIWVAPILRPGTN